MLDEETQVFILSTVLGEASPLIAHILEHMKVSAVQLRYSMHLCMGCLFLIKEKEADQVHQHELPPSTHLTALEVLEVLGNLFRLDHRHQYSDLLHYIKAKRFFFKAEQAEQNSDVVQG